MPVLIFRPRITVWLWFCGISSIPALTFVLTFIPRATVWLCCGRKSPAFTFVLIFIALYPFMLKTNLPRLDAALDLQGMRHRLVLLHLHFIGPHVRFDFHIYLFYLFLL